MYVVLRMYLSGVNSPAAAVVDRQLVLLWTWTEKALRQKTIKIGVEWPTMRHRSTAAVLFLVNHNRYYSMVIVLPERGAETEIIIFYRFLTEKYNC